MISISIESILTGISKVLMGDFAGCLSNFKRGRERYTNGFRMSAQCLGPIIAVLLLMNIFPNGLMKIFGDSSWSDSAKLLANIGDNSLAMMLGSRIFDWITRFFVFVFYYCKYG